MLAEELVSRRMPGYICSDDKAVMLWNAKMPFIDQRAIAAFCHQSYACQRQAVTMDTKSRLAFALLVLALATSIM